MKVLSIFTTALLSLAVVGTPIPDDRAAAHEALIADRRAQRQTAASAISARDAEAESVGLLKRAELNCEIVNVVTTVDCHYWPTHASTWNGHSNHVVTSFGPSTKHDFDCYLNGQTVGGVAAWDYAENWDCFVPGYYTDSHCTHTALGKCGFS